MITNLITVRYTKKVGKFYFSTIIFDIFSKNSLLYLISIKFTYSERTFSYLSNDGLYIKIFKQIQCIVMCSEFILRFGYWGQ
jgi:hypothetical protein